MSIQKKSLISALKTTKKANVASAPATETETKGTSLGTRHGFNLGAKGHASLGTKGGASLGTKGGASLGTKGGI